MPHALNLIHVRLGRRIVKRVYPAAGTPNVGYLRMVYTGDAVAFEADSAGTIGLRYTWGPGADNLLAIEDASGNHYYATTDRLGSVRSLAKRDGTWLLTRRWTPYGGELSRDSSASFTWGGRLRYGWTGRELDTETGLYFHRARYYAPTLRRFIQEDPVESSTSAYAYVNGSPLEATDPSGLIMSYEMRMTDLREAAFTGPRGPSSLIDGVPYAGGNNGFISGLLSGGGATANFIGAGMMLTRLEVRSLLNSRPLTDNEARAAKSELPTLDTERARIAYDSPFGRTAVTPRNTMHFPEYTSDCRDFITCKSGDYAGWFIHEATHVWQYQTGRSPVAGYFLSTDIGTRGDYLPSSGYMNLPSANGLSTEKEADWHKWHYELCTVRHIPDACAWR